MNSGRPDLLIGEWTVSPSRNLIERHNVQKSVQPLSMNILCHLADHSGEVVSSDALLEAFWKQRHTGDEAVHRRIADLRRLLEDDAREPSYIRTIQKRGYSLVAPVSILRDHRGATDTPEPETKNPSRVWIVATLILVGLLTGALILENRQDAGQDAGQDDADFLPVSVLTEPSGISVWLRDARSEERWQQLGTSPIRNYRLARGDYKIRLGDTVYLDASNPGPTFNTASVPERIITMPSDPVPPDMVYVPGGNYRLGAWGFSDAVDLGGFLMDRTEVTNSDYQEFVDAGGYEDARFWDPVIAQSGGSLSWQTIRETFIDATGRPGPAGWEMGTFPPRAGTQPVTGVSWYEAGAYLNYRQKMLPTAQHWLRAALGPMEWKYPVAARQVKESNLAGSGLEPVGNRRLAEHHGAYDLIGNAREWTCGHNGRNRIAMGSGFRDPPWQYNFPLALDPMSRDPDLGFRGIRLTVESRPVTDTEVALFNDFLAPVRRVSDEVFEGMSYQYRYQPQQIHSEDVKVLEEAVDAHWIRQRLSIPNGRPDGPLHMLVFLPRRGSQPYQSVLFMPPADSWTPGFSSEDIQIEDYELDMIPRSGRAFLWPIYFGSHERYDGYHAASPSEKSGMALERSRRIRDEIGRVIDFLQDNDAFDGERVGLIGLSFGAMLAAYSLATEPRIKTAVLYSTGIATPNPVFANPQNDPNLFWARVQQPVLVINGRYDPIRPHQLVLTPFMDLLATPAEDKKAVLLEAAHWPLPRQPLMEETLSWLDRYLGSVPDSGDQSTRRIEPITGRRDKE